MNKLDNPITMLSNCLDFLPPDWILSIDLWIFLIGSALLAWILTIGVEVAYIQCN